MHYQSGAQTFFQKIVGFAPASLAAGFFA